MAFRIRSFRYVPLLLGTLGSPNETENRVRKGSEFAVNQREIESWGFRSGRKRPLATRLLACQT